MSSSSSIGQVSVDFVAEFSRFREDVTKASRHVQDNTAKMAASFRVVEGAARLMEGALAAFGVGLGARELIDFADRAIEAGAQMKSLAEQAGVTTTTFQLWRFAAREAGTDADAMTTGIGNLTRKIGEAADGGDEAIKTFRGLGIGVLDAGGNIRSTDDILQQIARSVAAAKTPAEQARIAYEAFGKSGQQLIPTLVAMGSGSEEVAAKAQSMFQVLSPDVIRNLDAISADFEIMKNAALNLAGVLAQSLRPAVDDIAHSIADWVGDGNRMTAAIADANKLLAQTNAFIEREHELLQQIATDWRDYGAVTAEQQQKQLAAEKAITEAMQIRQRLMDNLAEMGERQRDPGLRHPTAPIAVADGQHNPVGATAAADAAKKQADAVKRVVDALALEYDNLGKDSEQQKLNTALRQANITAASATGQQIAAQIHAGEAYRQMLADMNREEQERNALVQQGRDLMASLETPAEKFTDQMVELDRLYAAGAVDLDQYNLAVARMNEAYEQSDPQLRQAAEDAKRMRDSVQDLAGDMGTELVRAFTDAGTASDRFRNLAIHALEDVLGWVVKLLLTSAGGGGGGGLGAIFSGIAGALFGGATGSPSAGLSPEIGMNFAGITHFAGGGDAAAGDLAIVGENGPELVRFGRAGHVFPNGSFLRSAGATNVYNIDARGAELGVEQRIMAALQQLHRSIEPRAIAAVNAQRKRGGSFAAAFAR